MKFHSLIWRLLLSALALSVAAPGTVADGPSSRPATQPSSECELHDFRHRGQPIHPACVMKLGTELADSLPAIAAVDIEGCTDSQQNPMAFTVRDGWIRIELKDGGWFAYRHLGVSPGGTHALHTQSSGGGTGVFEDLLLVRFHRDRVRQNATVRERLLMTSVGSFVLGDRDNGEIRIEGRRLIVGHSRYRALDTLIPLDAER